MPPTTLKVIEVVSRTGHTPASMIKPESILQEDLNMDSLDIIEIIIQLEIEFNITIPDGSYETCTDRLTIADLVGIVETELK